MVRAAGLLVGMALLGAWVPTRDQKAYLMALPAPASEIAAQEAAGLWLANRLANPGAAEITYRPTVRAALDSSDGDPSHTLLGVWMCGIVSGITTGGNRRTAVWRVRFDPDRPGQIYFGSIENSGQWRYLPKDCAEIYRDGFRVFPP